MQVLDISDFDETFEQAEINASTDREIDFVASIRGKLEVYGEKTYISEKQIEWLESIAERTSDE